jgi:electron transfer flavoprotein alpha subunit
VTGDPEQSGLRTMVLIKQVPWGDDVGDLDADGRLRRDGVTTDINPWWRRALAQAIRLSGPRGHSTAITMGPPAAVDVLREALGCGVSDTLHLCDPALAGADCLATARTLAAAVRRLGGADLVLVGRSSTDGNTSAVGAMVAELLGLPFVGPALGITLERTANGTTLHTMVQSEEGSHAVGVTLPAVVAIAERSCDPAKAPADTWPDAAEVGTVTLAALNDGDPVPPVSPTRVVGVRRTVRTRQPSILAGPLGEQVRQAVDLIQARREDSGPRPAGHPPAVPAVVPAAPAAPAVMVLADRADDAGNRALLGEAASLAHAAGGSVLAVVPPGSRTGRTPQWGAWGADDAVLLTGDSPRTTAAALADRIAADGVPWAVLGAARSWQREVLGRLAARLDAGLMSDLAALEIRHPAGGEPVMVGSKPSGSAGIADIVSHGRTQIATVRTGCLDMRQSRPESALRDVTWLDVAADPAVQRERPAVAGDYDALERAQVVVGVGQGVDPSQYQELLPLRTLLGAELAATRKVTDAGWLPHAHQLGITARDIAPRLYLVLGALGALNHMAGVARAGTVVAVNRDPAAPVFDHCDIGIVADWREVVPLLTAELERRERLAPVGSGR